jgi:tRNA modification GTPase
MDYNNNDIIIARATPIGKSALAVIRLSGSNLEKTITAFFSKKTLTPNLMQLKNIKAKHTGVVIDSCMVVFYKNPKSFTSEDMLEIFCHGNDHIVKNIINEFIAWGVRIAYPGEFSYRAFKNGKIDLLQAESIASKINQNSNQYGVALQNLEEGITSQKMKELRTSIINLQSIIEHELDFNEEEITHLRVEEITQKFKGVIVEIEQILNWSLCLQKIEQGYRVVFLGLPNAGKSTLFNRLVGVDKAIVTEIKGTTRDVLEANIYIQGIPFVLCDTAGYRKTKHKIETLGINKTKAMARNADIVVMLDIKDPIHQHNMFIKDNAFLQDKQTLFVKTKCDAGVTKTKEKTIELSCLKELGIDVLLTKLLTTVNLNLEKNNVTNIALCNMRQINLLKQIQGVFLEALDNLNHLVEMDIVASQLQDAAELFEELLGKMAPNEILNNIFKGFCVGK